MPGGTDTIIERIEGKFLPDVRVFLSEHFSNTFLPSHDGSHHLRCWWIARTILRELGRINDHITEDFVEAVFFAVLFHDSGMTLTRGEHHGAESAMIFRKYVDHHPDRVPAMHAEIIEAITYHDRKVMQYYDPVGPSEPPSLLTVVGAADDLDALGIIGIYRYAEIYLHRGIPLRSLGNRIMENAASRFNTFLKAYTLLPAVAGEHTSGYRTLIDFYDSYNQQLLVESYPEHTLSGHIGIINFIRHLSVTGHIHPSEIPDSIGASVGKLVVDFFRDLKRALEKGG